MFEKLRIPFQAVLDPDVSLEGNGGDLYRYERKFFVSELTAREVEGLIKLHPAMFSEIYYRRYVNNIYFDTPGTDYYSDNVAGSMERVKARIRWYGDLMGRIEKPVLELKRKKGLLGSKESFPLRPFELGRADDLSSVTAAFENSDLPDHLLEAYRHLEPTLLNRYGRKYYLSADRVFRMTTDTELSFYPIGKRNNSFLHKWSDDVNVIVELKYDRGMEAGADAVAGAFPFRMTRSSKYVSGLERMYAW